MRLPSVGSLFHGRYSLERVLGEGGFSTVFAATDTAARRPVAVKILKPDKRGYPEEVASRFRREVKVVANLSDPHTVTMFDSGTSDDGLLFMVFEHVPGEDLSQFITRHGALSAADAIHILTQVLQSLREAHRAGLLHRDIKPANIRIYEYAGDPLRAKLLDFGIARPNSAEASRITRPGELVGTPRYMSPEQLLEKELTPASDIYSLGLVMLECLMGRALEHGNSWSDQVGRLADGFVFDVGAGTYISPLLRQVVLRMCARDPARRYQDVSTILRDLGQQLSSDAIRQSALNDMLDHAPTARLDASSEALSTTPVDESASVSDASLEEATTRRRSHKRSRRKKKGLNPLHVIIALLFGAIVALVAVLFVIWPRPEPGSVAPEPVRTVPFVKPPTQTVPAVAAAPATLDFGRDTRGSNPPNGTPGCGRQPERRGLIDVETVNGLAKESHLAYLPRNYDPESPHPVIFLFHDAGQAPDHNIEFAGFADIAEQHGVVLLAPTGAQIFDGSGLYLSVWEDDNALAPALALWDASVDDFCLDRERVFAVGHAAGGYAAHKMACHFGLTALAMNGHVKVVTDRVCKPDPATPTMIVLGRADGYSPRKGGVNCANVKKLSWKAVDDRWKEFNSCRGRPTTFVEGDGGRCQRWECETTYARCDIDGGREWPGTRPMFWDRFNQNCGGQPGNFPTVETIWEFFAAAPPRAIEALE